MPGESSIVIGLVVFAVGSVFSVIFAVISIFDEKNTQIVIKFQRLFISAILIGIGLMVLGVIRLMLLN